MSKDKLHLTSDRNLDTVETYEFDLLPIKGFPELRWAGKRPFRSTHYYPAQLKENHGEPVDGWMNEIYWGDNLQVMSHLLKKYRGKIKLIYIDPPFDSKADYKKKIQLKGKTVTSDQLAFEEKQYTDIWTDDEYLQFMYERLIVMRELLADDGSIFVHCDWHKGHFMRCILDEVFGVINHMNHIIWNYESGGIPQDNFSRKHDDIIVYNKTKNRIFNKEKASYQRNKCQKCGSIMDKWNNLKKVIDENGRIYRTIKSAGKLYKYYDDEPALLSDVWLDIHHIQQKDPQRIGYPTQKPEALIERIIKTSSNPGDIVFDCFMGSGTTQAVAMKLGRKFIGADINLGAIQITTKRLLQVREELSRKDQKEEKQEFLLAAEPTPGYGEPAVWYTGFSVYNVNNYDIFRNPVQAKGLLLEALEIQKLPGNSVFDGEKDGRMVKILPVNRIATRADLNGLISNLDYKTFEKRQSEYPGKPVEHITLVCMGHEPDLAAAMQEQVHYKLDIDVVDILRDRQDIQFKRDSEVEIRKENGKLVIKEFYPMNLLQKLSLMKENVKDWKEMVESIMIDFYFDGVIFEPQEVDVPGKKDLVKGIYAIPDDASTIRVKITDLLSESLEKDVK
jgi:DNA modification methylase